MQQETVPVSSTDSTPPVWPKLLDYGLALLLLLTLVLATVLMLTIYSDYDISDFTPSTTDEKYYWHQILTFQVAGFDGGYYTIDEIPAKVDFSRYYTKGPLFPMLYGTLGRITGWYANTGLYINFAVLMGALAVFVVAIGLDRRRLIAATVLLLTFWPLLLFVYSMTMEAIVAAGAIISAAVFYVTIKREQSLSPVWKWLFVAVLFFASQLRGGTWIPLIIIFFVLSARDKRLTRLIFDLLQGLVIGAFSFWLFSQLSQPRSNLFSTMPTSRAGIRITLNRIGANLWNFNRGYVIWILLRYQALILSLGATGLVLSELWKKRQPINQILVNRPQWFWECVFHAVNLGGVLAANIVLYNMFDWRDYRVIAPHVLISALLLIGFKRYRIVTVLIITNLLVFISFLAAWNDLSTPNFTYDRAAVVAFEDAIAGQIAYDPDADSAWCNTLLMVDSDLLFDIEVLAIPGGIGLSRMNQTPRQLEEPFKSRYLLIRDETRARYGESLQAVLLAETPLGGLYENQEADCEP